MIRTTNNIGFDKSFYTLIANRETFKVVKKRSNASVIMNGKPILKVGSDSKRTKEEIEAMKTMFSILKKQAIKYFIKNKNVIVPIEKKHIVVFRNGRLYDSLENDAEFYCIDIRHCYWRIAYLIGWISKGIYEKYINQKELRNKSLGSIQASKKVIYVKDGIVINEFEESNELFKILYTNVRHTAYNVVGDIAKSIGLNCVLKYNMDAIFIFEKDISKVQKWFNKNKLFYKIKLCNKVDNIQYRIQDELFKF